MFLSYDKYEDFIKTLLIKLPVMRTQQLLLALMNYYPELSTSKLASQVLWQTQRDGYLLMTEAGFCLRREWYFAATGDQFGDSIDRSYIYQPYLKKELDIYGTTTKNVNGVESLEYGIIDHKSVSEILTFEDMKPIREKMNCFWIIVDQLPYSINFTSCVETPWAFSYEYDPSGLFMNEDMGMTFATEEDKNSEETGIYQLVKINSTNADSRFIELRQGTKVPKNMRDKVHRIALVESEYLADLVPYIGFSNIAIFDKKQPNFYRVIQKRSDDERWKDED